MSARSGVKVLLPKNRSDCVVQRIGSDPHLRANETSGTSVGVFAFFCCPFMGKSFFPAFSHMNGFILGSSHQQENIRKLVAVNVTYVLVLTSPRRNEN